MVVYSSEYVYSYCVLNTVIVAIYRSGLLMHIVTRKTAHRTQMPQPKCHSEKGYICNCDVQHEAIVKVDMAHTRFTIWNLVKGR